MEDQQRPFFQYLPEFYRQDPSISRLCSLFEQVYAELGGEIAGLADQLYDPEHTPKAYLGFVGRLTGLGDREELLTQAQLRALLPIARSLQQRKGTRAALEEFFQCILSIQCGHSVPLQIIEFEDWQTMPKALAAAFPALYAGERDFAILIGPEPLLQDAKEKGRLEVLAREYAPAYSSPHVVVLPTQTVLGNLGYLGYNTWLGG